MYVCTYVLCAEGRDGCNVKVIFSALFKSKSVKGKWKLIGQGLGLSAETLDSIEKKHFGRDDHCFYTTLKTWVGSEGEKPKTYRTIVDVLKSDNIKEHLLAESLIAEKGTCTCMSTYIIYVHIHLHVPYMHTK